MAKKRPASIILQQRKNFAAAKSKLVDHVKETYVDPLKSNPNEPKEPRAKFGSWEGKVSTALGMAPSQNENRVSHFETGATEHISSDSSNGGNGGKVISMGKYKEDRDNRRTIEDTMKGN